jgi:hypothetical protein
MSNNSVIKNRILFCYAVVFTASFAINWFYNLTLSQINPIVFNANLDITEAAFFVADIARNLQASKNGFLILDVLFLLANLSMCYLAFKRNKLSNAAIIACLFYNLFYAVICNLFTHLSIQGWLCWFWMPICFLGKKEEDFYFSFSAIRFLFALFFFSAAIWKIRTGSLWNTEQMSAIFLQQHSALLTAENNWFKTLMLFFIKNKALAYCLFLAGFFCEFIFATAFFTKRLDKLLACFLFAFILLDFMLMKINYFSWLVYIPLFWYGHSVTKPSLKN